MSWIFMDILRAEGCRGATGLVAESSLLMRERSANHVVVSWLPPECGRSRHVTPGQLRGSRVQTLK